MAPLDLQRIGNWTQPPFHFTDNDNDDGHTPPNCNSMVV
ncbi:hypothetical protein CCACVL1_17596 [Corchorus capsularis]|uniref:Uncharacterized protein n=1 Tax=Corchorus capsularis TaxID=210143 RepID=A0A1R3HR13_COCAP|nr:hypothetical protein CCACVL1_17596 [Corchorus capsularis]